MIGTIPQQDRPYWLTIKNVSSEVIPAWACVYPKVTPADGLVAEKHTKDSAELFAFVGSLRIEIGGFGYASLSYPCQVLGAGANNEEVGPSAGSWTVSAGFRGLRAIGAGQAPGTVLVTSTSSSAAFLAKLTAKQKTTGRYRAYSWTRVTDTRDPVPITYTDETEEGTPGTNPAYSEWDVDIPVPSVVRLRRGAGPWYLLDQLPRWEFVRKTGTSDSAGEKAYIAVWDQTANAMTDEKEIRLVNLNAS